MYKSMMGAKIDNIFKTQADNMKIIYNTWILLCMCLIIILYLHRQTIQYDDIRGHILLIQEQNA